MTVGQPADLCDSGGDWNIGSDIFPSLHFINRLSLGDGDNGLHVGCSRRANGIQLPWEYYVFWDRNVCVRDRSSFVFL